MQSRMQITCVTTIGGYLRIYGQQNIENVAIIQKNIDCLMRAPMIQTSVPIMDIIQIGNFCLALKDDKFVRARIVSKFVSAGRVNVHYIDYGFDNVVDIKNVRMSKFPKELELMAVQSTPFMISGIKNIWEPYQIKEISDELLYQTIEFYIEEKIGEDIFIQIKWKNKPLNQYILENKGYGELVTLEYIRKDYVQATKIAKFPSNSYIKGYSKNIRPARPPYSRNGYDGAKPGFAPSDLSSFRSMVQGIQNQNYKVPYTGPPLRQYLIRPQFPDQLYQKIGIPTFKTTTLLVGNAYEIVVSDVHNGPCSFSVQLHGNLKDLYKIMSEISDNQLHRLSQNPKIGMACIARCPKIGLQYYRAVIMNIDLTSCKVLFADFGNTENIPFCDLFDVPSPLLDVKCFSFRFALSGYKELEPINDSLKELFKKNVLNKILKLKVTPLEGPPLVQYCELYFENVNIFNTLKEFQDRKINYVKSEILQQDEIVNVCYIESPKSFYVQKKNNQNAFEKIMDELFFYCNKNRCTLKKLIKGTPCAVKYENAWYRAEIIKVDSNDKVFIRQVDYGVERHTNMSTLNYIDERFTSFPLQAIQCCLKGFEDNSSSAISDSVINQFEMLAEESDGSRRNFKVKIFKMLTSHCYLLNLVDDSLQPELNLMKRLFKLNLPFNKYIGMEKELNANSTPAPSAAVDNNITAAKPQGFAPVQNQHDNYLTPKRAQVPVVNIEVLSPNAYNQNNWDTNSNSGSSSRSSNRGFRRGQRKNISPKDTSRNNSRDSNSSTGRGGRGGRGRNLPPRFQNQRQNDRQQNLDKNGGIYDTSGRFTQSNSSEDWPKHGSTSYRNKIERDDSEFESSTTEFLPFNTELKYTDIVIPSIQDVVICWWISPHQFFTHDCKLTSRFEKMMRKMQTFYKNQKPAKGMSLEVGSIIIAKYKQDNVLYRAKVLACNPQMKKYKVEFIDFGNRSIVEENDIWQIEKRFAQVPVMANLCSFENIISNFENQKLIDFIAKYLKQGVTLKCNYLKKENNSYFVSIKLKDDSLKELLLKEGMISELKEGTKLHILTGQQIKAKVVSVVDLLNFVILIEGCDLNLRCCYHNNKLLKSNPELSSKFKNIYQGKYCMFDIISVTQDKILMIDPIDTEFTKELPPSICDYPVISDKLDVKITYVGTPNRLYAQTISNEEKSKKLLNEMRNYYSEKGQSLENISKGVLCAANSKDGNWYRAHILSIKSNVGVGVETNKNDSIVEVYYFDYGNNEIIDNINKLKRLEENFLISSALAMEIFLPFKSIKTMDQQSVIKEIRNLVGNYQLELKIFEFYEGCWLTDILSSDYSVLNVLEEKKFIEKKYDFEYIKNFILSDLENEITPSVKNNNVEENKIERIKSVTSKEPTEKIRIQKKEEDEMIDEPPSNIPMQTTVESSLKIPNAISAYISHFDNPGKFYVQLDTDTQELQKMQDNLQIVAEQLPLLKTISKDEKCVARYSVDGVWYRAKVFDNELIAVQFIDYGNIDVVEVSEIKQIVEPFTDIKTFAIPCSLAVAPKNSTDWPEEGNQFFYENRDKKFCFNYILQNEKKNFVNLFIDNVNVTDDLFAKDLVKRLEIVKSGESCFISHINGLSDFYVQMESYSDGLEAIASYLSGYSEFALIPRNSSNNIGMICAAIFPDDSEWYRAKILSETEAGFEVLFIDFGNTTITTEARVISDEIAKAPYLSKKCCLRMPSNILEWSQKAEEKFIELAAGGETVFSIELKKPGEAAVVDLLMEETNILDIVQPLCDENVNAKLRAPGNDILSMSLMTMSTLSDSCGANHEIESVVISHVNSPIDFYVQLNSEVSDLEMVTDKLFDVVEVLSNPEIGQICAALYPKDENYYRAKILSKETDGYNVLYIDFGNCSITKDFKVLPDQLKTIQNLAKHVSLAGVGFDLSAENVIEKFNEILEPFFTENLDMIILDKKIVPWVVKLNLNGEDICNRLKTALGYSIMNKSDIFLPSEVNEKFKNIIVSHISSANEFYIQLENEVDQIESITNKLTKFGEMTQVTDPPEINYIYAAIFPEDGSYYRAKVVNVDSSETEVYFVDFGNSTKTSDLRCLPDDLKKIKNMANKCSLVIEDSDSNYDKINEAFLKYMDSHFGEMFQMEVINPSDESWKIKLYNKNINIYNEIQKISNSESSEKENCVVNSFQRCTVSHINNPNDFYVQIADNDIKLNEIVEKLLAADKFVKLNDIKIGDICAAKFPDDGAYYRAKVLLLGAENGAKVIYMDFGNEAFTDDLRELSDDLKTIPPLAKRCALENLSDNDFWSKNAEECFSSIIEEHFNETFQVNVIKDTKIQYNSLENFSNEIDPAIVQLDYQNLNIAEKLSLTLKEKCNIKSQNALIVTPNWDESSMEQKNNANNTGTKAVTEMKDTDSNTALNVAKGIFDESFDNCMKNREIPQDFNSDSTIIKPIVDEIINNCPLNVENDLDSAIMKPIINEIINNCPLDVENDLDSAIIKPIVNEIINNCPLDVEKSSSKESKI